MNEQSTDSPATPDKKPPLDPKTVAFIERSLSQHAGLEIVIVEPTELIDIEPDQVN